MKPAPVLNSPSGAVLLCVVSCPGTSGPLLGSSPSSPSHSPPRPPRPLPRPPSAPRKVHVTVTKKSNELFCALGVDVEREKHRIFTIPYQYHSFQPRNNTLIIVLLFLPFLEVGWGGGWGDLALSLIQSKGEHTLCNQLTAPKRHTHMSINIQKYLYRHQPI